MVDPTGEIAISTLILVGSIVAGLAVSAYTAYVSQKNTGKVDWGNTIVSGVSTFCFFYTYGMSAYGMYLSYCDYKGYTPTTIGKTTSPTIDYPPNNGFNSTPRNSTLQPGSTIQRIGGEQGRFVAPVNTPAFKLSLPPDKINAPATNYTVLKPIPVQAGTAMPWYGQPGGGTQFLLPSSISSLQRDGYLIIFQK